MQLYIYVLQTITNLEDIPCPCSISLQAQGTNLQSDKVRLLTNCNEGYHAQNCETSDQAMKQ